ncbi:metallophosphoesterase [Candidatus Methylomirabilis sp.]|uniref:metallophosphoesterase family protein n=1 Tax=Candidatus Methylomirabilis sp. TaxID=2032687 RepID=UPI002A60624A|nr:metallophosphoesterase [Candidatus Methylomirabilis sp.]
MNGIFRVAHLSDLHLSSLIDVKIRDLLNKRALGYLSWRLRRRREHAPEVLAALLHDLKGLTLDHVVITGDLTHIGLPDEFRQARQWLETLGSSNDVTVIPGNHDAYVRTPWADTFALWTPYMASDQRLQIGKQQTPGRSFFPSVRVRGHTALIGVTSAHPSAPFFATGSLGAAQINRLGDILDLTRRQGLFRILLIHHLPMAAMVAWRKRLTDGATLRALLARHGVEMVLYGHTHRSAVLYLPEVRGNIPMMGVPSASARGRKPEQRAGYHVYEVCRSSHGWEVRTTARGYSPGNHCFLAEDQHVIRVADSAAGSLCTTVHPHGYPTQHGQRA